MPRSVSNAWKHTNFVAESFDIKLYHDHDVTSKGRCKTLLRLAATLLIQNKDTEHLWLFYIILLRNLFFVILAIVRHLWVKVNFPLAQFLNLYTQNLIKASGQSSTHLTSLHVHYLPRQAHRFIRNIGFDQRAIPLFTAYVLQTEYSKTSRLAKI